VPISDEHTFVGEFSRNWQYARNLTYSLLEVVSADNLGFSPHHEFGTLGRQLWHCGHVQECYRQAMVSGDMVFGLLTPDKELEVDPEALAGFLEELDDDLAATLRGLRDYTAVIDWGLEEENPELRAHLIWLLQHETLHHGQWSLYARLGGFEVPETWRDAWGM